MQDVILEKLTGVFSDVFDDDSLVLHRGLTAADVEGWDSLTHIRLMLSVERVFPVRLSAPEIGKLQSVGDLMDLIARKTA